MCEKFDYYDNYFLETQRKYLECGYKRYKERKHLYYEFKLFYLNNQMFAEWERFDKNYEEETKRLRQEKAAKKRAELEAQVVDILLKKEGSVLFYEEILQSIKQRVSSMTDKKLRYHIKKYNAPKKPKATLKTYEIVNFANKEISSKELNKMIDQLGDLDTMFPKLRDYTEIQILKIEFNRHSKGRKVTRENIIKIINAGHKRENPMPFIRLALWIVNRHLKYNLVNDLLERILAKYPKIYKEEIDPKMYSLITGLPYDIDEKKTKKRRKKDEKKTKNPISN